MVLILFKQYGRDRSGNEPEWGRGAGLFSIITKLTLT